MKRQEILSLISEDEWMMDILRFVETLKLPDWWIGAGFVRSKVWDHLHGYSARTPLPDIDIIYFDPKKKFEEREVWSRLKSQFPDQKWSVTNTAFRHLRTGQKKRYKSSKEALSEWVETATGIGVSLLKGKLELSAPNGIYDLVNLVLRPTKTYKDKNDVFENRIRDKKWLEKWPRLRVAK